MSPPLRPQQQITLTIDRLGGLGDGIGLWEGQTVFVAHSLPGETVRAAVESITKDSARASLQEILEASPLRQHAPCPHFSMCGGCALQHFSPESYRDFKRGTLLSVIARLGYSPEVVGALIEAGPGARRRAEFTLRVAKGVVSIGFMRPRSHELIDITSCPVTAEAILGLLPGFRDCVAALKKPGNIESIAIADLGHGLDVMVSLKERLSSGDRARLAAFGEDTRILRLAVQSPQGIERLSQKGEVRVRLGTIEVELPIGAFQQATMLGQTAITASILKHTAGFTRVADIYSGCGTYAIPLAQAGHRVQAYEGGQDMMRVLHNAAQHHMLDLAAHQRDLFRQPLSAEELGKFDAAVINPPRNGALPQFQALAKSALERIVVVSCNPATFERDAKVLKDAGYLLLEATPIDQFTWSPHLELVAVFERVK